MQNNIIQYNFKVKNKKYHTVLCYFVRDQLMFYIVISKRTASIDISNIYVKQKQ